MAGRTRLLVTWTEVTGYAAACWRALAARGDVEARFVAGPPGEADPLNAFDDALSSMDLTLLAPRDPGNVAAVGAIADAFVPSVVLVSGWNNQAYTHLAHTAASRGRRAILALDTTLHRPLRQLLGRLRLSRLIRRTDLLLVPGARGREFLKRWWRIPESRIRTGLYGFDAALYQGAQLARRLGQARTPGGGWGCPRQAGLRAV
jgi:hypothetical protein